MIEYWVKGTYVFDDGIECNYRLPFIMANTAREAFETEDRKHTKQLSISQITINKNGYVEQILSEFINTKLLK